MWQMLYLIKHMWQFSKNQDVLRGSELIMLPAIVWLMALFIEEWRRQQAIEADGIVYRRTT